MSDAPTTDPIIAEDDPDSAPAWFDPDIPTSREFNDDEGALAKLLRPAPNTPEDPDASDPGPDEPGDEEPDEATPLEEVEGEPTPAGEGAPPVEAPTPPVVAPETTGEAPAQYIEFAGRRYPVEQAEQIAQLIDLGIQAVTNAPMVPQAPAVPETPTGPDVPAFNPEDFVDPEMARATLAQIEAVKQVQAPLQEKLDQLLQAESRREQAAEQARLRDMQAAEAEAVTAIKGRFQLNDTEFAELYNLTERSGVVNGMAQANPQLPFRELAENALSTVYYSTEKFRERDIQQQVATQVADAVQSKQVADKKSRAGKLAGAGGSVSRATTPAKGPNGQPRDPLAEALAAVREEVV